MDWIQGFLNKHCRQQVFDDASKPLPPYPECFVLKQVYCKITQWQGKDVGHPGWCLGESWRWYRDCLRAHKYIISKVRSPGLGYYLILP